jgi:arachidonate 15-lipoxygenase
MVQKQDIFIPPSLPQFFSTPSLPQNDSTGEKLLREFQLMGYRDIFFYSTASGLPMPMADSRGAVAQGLGLLDWVEGQATNQAKIFLDIELWKAETFGQNITSLADYAKVFTTFQTPSIVQNWQDDRVFGSQRLAGLNPMTISLVTLDGAKGVKWADLSAKLSPQINDDATIQQAVSQNRLYVTDYTPLGAATAGTNAPGWQKGNKLQAPIALYVQTQDFAGLQPVAIQLDQKHVYLASEASQPGNKYKWLMAKIFIQCADINLNQVVNHLTFTHLVEEAFALATFRRLSTRHPLNILLTKHFAALLVINELGILTLISQSGIIQQIFEGGVDGSLELIANAYQNWTFDDMDFPNDLARRGVDNPTSLPYFPFRDDGMLIWNLLGQYVREYINHYYTDDNAVVLDYELQAWAQQLGGALDAGAGGVPGFPKQIGTCKQLADIVQRIIWTAGPQHAAVNFPQIDYTTFIPNSSGSTYLAPVDGNVDEATLLQILAPKEQTEVQVKASYALAGYHYDQLLNYDLNTADGSDAIVKKYYQQLTTTVRKTIVESNNKRAAQAGLLVYPYFLPENIPNSTSV